jgi:hypothetical protein
MQCRPWHYLQVVADLGLALMTRYSQVALPTELREVIARPAVTRREIYAARRSIMRRAPKKYGCLPPELRPRLLY